MTWIKCKEKLPKDGEIVIAKFKYSSPYYCIARYCDHLISIDKEYKHIFIPIVHPRFPKIWLFSEEYKKISRINKSKVDSWMSFEIPWGK